MQQIKTRTIRTRWDLLIQSASTTPGPGYTPPPGKPDPEPVKEPPGPPGKPPPVDVPDPPPIDDPKPPKPDKKASGQRNYCIH